MQNQNALRPEAPPPTLRVVETPPQTSVDLSTRTYAVILAAIVTFAAVVRAGFVLGSDFPLNDGGLFLQMARDLADAGYRLPATTSYNGDSIPFAYPPLGFYTAAALDRLTPLDLFDVFRWLPLAGGIAIVGAFVLVARALLPTRLHVIVAVVSFSTLPATFQWMIMGGGVTRSLGFVFALLAIERLVRFYDHPTLRGAALPTALAALALGSHLEMGLVVAYSGGVLFLSRGRSAAGVRGTLAIAGGVLALTAPWWATVLAYHGPDPFVAASQTGSTPLQPLMLILQFQPTLEPGFQLQAALTALGVLLMVTRRQFMLPLWLVATAVFDARAFPTSVSFVAAMLVSYAVVDVILPLTRGDSAGASGAPRWVTAAACTFAIVFVTAGALVTTPRLLTGMTSDERNAMSWVADNTPPDSTFAIVSEDRWPIDRTSEWFPVLSERESVATVQGQEFVGGGSFGTWIDEHLELQRCGRRDATCLDTWVENTGRDFDYVYIPKLAPTFSTSRTNEMACCYGLQESLRRDRNYTEVYDGAGAIIFKRE